MTQACRRSCPQILDSIGSINKGSQWSECSSYEQIQAHALSNDRSGTHTLVLTDDGALLGTLSLLEFHNEAGKVRHSLL